MCLGSCQVVIGGLLSIVYGFEGGYSSGSIQGVDSSAHVIRTLISLARFLAPVNQFIRVVSFKRCYWRFRSILSDIFSISADSSLSSSRL